MSENAIAALGPGILAGRRDAIVHFRHPLIADLRFEWHRSPSKVYAVRCGTPEDPIDRADMIAERVNTEEEYRLLAGIFLRGGYWGQDRTVGGAPELPKLSPIIFPH